MKPGRFSTGGLACAAGVICLIVYLRALGCDFVDYDDPDYVLNNPLIRELDLRLFVSAFGESYKGWWMPLTWISFAVDYHFWGLNPVGYHLTNIILHSVNAALLLFIAARISTLIQGKAPAGGLDDGSRATLGQSGYLYPLALLFAALLWGIHPLRVESVAWVTERKDVLNGLFSLASIHFYLRYAERRQEGERAARFYLFSLLMFALSLMAKSVSVVLPAMLLVIDWYPLGRVQKEKREIAALLAEKIPFLLLSVLMVLITLGSTSKAGYLVPYSVFPFGQRLAVSGNALFEYCRLMIYPGGILPFYLIPDPIPLSFSLKSALFAAIAFCCFYLRNRYPWMLATLLLFMLPLLPVLAFFQNGDQAYAARFTYLAAPAPAIAVALLLATIISETLKTARWRCFGLFAALSVLLLYGAVTVRDISVWQDSVSMWTRVIDIRPEVASYKERGKQHAARGDYPAAANDFSAAIGMADGVWRRTVYNLYAYRGEVYRLMGRPDLAVRDFTAAILLYPHPVYYHYRGLALRQAGETDAAERDFAEARGVTGPLDWYDAGER